MRAMDARYGTARARKRLSPHRATPAVSLLSIHSIARDVHIYRTATLPQRIFVAHLSRTAI
jgi:hypothetical protein